MTRSRLNGGSIGLNNSTSLSSAYGVFALAEQSSYVLAGRWPSVPGQFTINNSLRFRSSATAYLNRTPASAGSQTTWTWSTWVKRGTLGIRQFITMSGINPNASQVFQVEFDANNKLSFYNQTIGVFRLTTAVYRDVGAWYHIVFVADTSNATAQSRFRVWVNGVEITVWDTNSTISSSYAFAYNGAYLHGIGAYTYSGNVFSLDGYMAEVNFIDGQALTASSFGTYDTNGVWQPIKYSGTYGTNGFYLNFGNTTSTTTLGYDTSGNSNNWTTNNISLTAGSTYDSMTDSPTVSSATVANYAVMNPVFATPSTTYSNGNLTFTRTGSVDIQAASTFAMPSGKFYWELTVSTLAASTNLSVGIMKNTQTSGVNSANTPFVYWNGNGNAYRYGTNLGALGTTFAAGNVLGFALDMTAGTISLYKNNTLISTTSSVDTTIPHYVFWDSYASGDAGSYNFGQQPYTYTPPTGFNALNTYNLPTPTIANGAQYMAATLYTGNGTNAPNALVILNSNNNVAGTTFQPDFTWIQSRSLVSDHILQDSVRGTSVFLVSDTTGVDQLTGGGDVSSFNSNGFTISYNNARDNQAAATYVAWQWQAGKGVTSANTNGSVTSTTSVNQTAGFSVVTYTGVGVNINVGHGLSAAPNLILIKSRSAAQDWVVYHSAVGTGKYLILDTTAATTTDANYFTAVTSTVFSSTGASPNMNTNAATYVAYCWNAVPGFSAFGSYTGNGSTDGPFIYTGFRPRWWLVKRTDTVESWNILDSSRDPYNQSGLNLYPNLTNAESSNDLADLVSNGVKLRNTWTGANTSGGTYIYAAFAENPFNTARAR